MVKQECIVSTEPTVYSTLVPMPLPPPPSTQPPPHSPTVHKCCICTKMLEMWRRRRKRIKSPSEDPWFHLQGPWVKIVKFLCLHEFLLFMSLALSSTHQLLPIKWMSSSLEAIAWSSYVYSLEDRCGRFLIFLIGRYQKDVFSDSSPVDCISIIYFIV